MVARRTLRKTHISFYEEEIDEISWINWEQSGTFRKEGLRDRNMRY